MVIQAERDRVRQLLRETLPTLCRSGLSSTSDICVEALIGVTLNKHDVFIVSIKETLQSEDDVYESRDAAPDDNVVRLSKEEILRSKRKWRRQKRKKQESETSIEDDVISKHAMSPSKLDEEGNEDVQNHKSGSDGAGVDFPEDSDEFSDEEEVRREDTVRHDAELDGDLELPADWHETSQMLLDTSNAPSHIKQEPNKGGLRAQESESKCETLAPAAQATAETSFNTSEISSGNDADTALFKTVQPSKRHKMSYPGFSSTPKPSDPKAKDKTCRVMFASGSVTPGIDAKRVVHGFRKRGRPKKYKQDLGLASGHSNGEISSDKTSQQTSIKRKRGRPRKYRPQLDLSPCRKNINKTTAIASQVMSIRRKRGRPRKYFPNDTIKLGHKKNEMFMENKHGLITGCRKRGRPRKYNPHTNVLLGRSHTENSPSALSKTEQLPRKRGRPLGTVRENISSETKLGKITPKEESAVQTKPKIIGSIYVRSEESDETPTPAKPRSVEAPQCEKDQVYSDDDVYIKSESLPVIWSVTSLHTENTPLTSAPSFTETSFSQGQFNLPQSKDMELENHLTPQDLIMQPVVDLT